MPEEIGVNSMVDTYGVPKSVYALGLCTDYILYKRERNICVQYTTTSVGARVLYQGHGPGDICILPIPPFTLAFALPP
jgi:hypothetical protein